MYIPFDSPHYGGNIPLFTQAVYKHFKFTNVFAFGANAAMIDDASVDMGLYDIYNSPELTSSGIFHKELVAFPPSAAIEYQNEINNNFVHQYTHTNDTRKNSPSFCRNIAVSTASYKDNYTTTWNLTPGMNVFKQTLVPGGFVHPLGWAAGLLTRKIWASEYSSTEPQTVFNRNDVYGGTTWWGMPYFFAIKRKVNFLNANEYDMCQSGYKSQFYDIAPTGSAFILRSSAAYLGNQIYDFETAFLPLVSALAIREDIWFYNNLDYNLQDKDLFIEGIDVQTGLDIISETHGYPHLGHPAGHFNITPFEAVYADEINWDHIVMGKTVEDYLDPSQTYYDDLRDFLNDEVEGWVMPLQNKIIGQNHNQANLPVYRAWYKARQTVLIGREVTFKTDPGDFIIQSSGDVTVYANESVEIKNGFHAKAGSEFRAFINEDCYLFNPQNQGMSLPEDDTSLEFEKSESSFDASNLDNKEQPLINVYPNPNTGIFTFELKHSNLDGQIYVYSLEGKLQFSSVVNKARMTLNLNLDKGVYLVVYKGANYSSSIKMIIN